MITTTTNTSGTPGQFGTSESGSTLDTWAHLGPSSQLGTPGPKELEAEIDEVFRVHVYLGKHRE